MGAGAAANAPDTLSKGLVSGEEDVCMAEAVGHLLHEAGLVQAVYGGKGEVFRGEQHGEKYREVAGAGRHDGAEEVEE